LRQPKGPFQARHVREQRVLAHLDAVHDDLAGDGGAKLSLPPIFGAERPFMPFSSTKPRIWLSCAADFAHTTNTSAMGEFEIHILEPEMR
jgi:hypothetical protein